MDTWLNGSAREDILHHPKHDSCSDPAARVLLGAFVQAFYPWRTTMTEAKSGARPRKIHQLHVMPEVALSPHLRDSQLEPNLLGAATSSIVEHKTPGTSPVNIRPTSACRTLL